MISKLNNQELVSGLKHLVGEEKKIIQDILEHLREVEGRRLYSLRGFPSLFEFCVKELGYSESSAQRRISSMRLMKTLPEAKEKLESGAVNLSTLSQLQTFIRKEENIKNKKLDHSQKLELLAVIENKSQRECEREFVKISPEAVRQESLKPFTQELSKLSVTISKGLERKLEELKNLLSHKNKTNTTSELLEILADMALQNLRKQKPLSQPPRQEEDVNAAAAVNDFLQSFQAIKREVYKRDRGQCQYTDPLTQRKCQSRYKIQYDHIHPQGLGGGDIIDNLQLLCQSHNILRATQAYSKEHMQKYLGGV